MNGRELGPYRVLDKLGEVYKASDTIEIADALDKAPVSLTREMQNGRWAFGVWRDDNVGGRDRR